MLWSSSSSLYSGSGKVSGSSGSLGEAACPLSELPKSRGGADLDLRGGLPIRIKLSELDLTVN